MKRENYIVPKHIGFEIELGNHFIAHDVETAAGEALVEAHHRLFTHREAKVHDTVREFDACGFRVYLDHEHAEICSPLVPSAALLTLAMRDARRIGAASKLQAERHAGPIRVSLNNTSRQGTAWAFHGNFLVSRSAFNAWRNADWRPLQKQWIPFLVTGLPLFGTGKVGSECGATPCAYQLGQRADFIDEEIGLATTEHKNLINTRDEPLADPERYARLHVIALGTPLMEFATWLRFGAAQLTLALIEEGAPMPNVQLRDPRHALSVVSRDLEFKERLKFTRGCKDTALGIQRRLAEAASEAIVKGCAAAAVPDAEVIAEQWIETLDDLASERPRLSRRLDWCAKLSLLAKADERRALSQDELRYLDLRYAEIGGLFEELEKAGAVDQLEDFLPRGCSASDLPRLLPREEARALLVNRFNEHLADLWWDYAIGRDEQGHPWFISMADPVDGTDLLRAIKGAPDWGKCLSTLADEGLASRAPEGYCAVLERGEILDREIAPQERKEVRHECCG